MTDLGCMCVSDPRPVCEGCVYWGKLADSERGKGNPFLHVTESRPRQCGLGIETRTRENAHEMDHCDRRQGQHDIRHNHRQSDKVKTASLNAKVRVESDYE